MSSEIKIPDYPESVLISSRTGDLRTSSYIVLPKGEPLFSAYATTIAVDDEAGGCFIVLSACSNEGHQKIKIDFAEWPLVCEAVERLRKEWVGK